MVGPPEYTYELDVIQYLNQYTEGDIELRALPNSPGGGNMKRLFSRNKKKLLAFIQRFDGAAGTAADRGMFYGVCTRLASNAHNGGADFCQHAPAAWIDIDIDANFRAQGTIAVPADYDTTITTLLDLPYPPSIIVHSGHGLHAYWRFTEPLDVQDPDGRRKIEALNRRLAGILGGDPKSCDVARILRIPGTMNTKHDPHVRCEALPQLSTGGGPDIEPDDLMDWLATVQTPLMQGPAPLEAVSEQAATDPFTAYAQMINATKSAVDIDQILLDMGHGNIHDTQRTALASMLSRGHDAADAIDAIEQGTVTAAAMWQAEHGRQWDWSREHKKLERDAVAFINKRLGREEYGVLKTRRAERMQAGGEVFHKAAADTAAAAEPAAKPGEEPWRALLQYRGKSGGLFENTKNAEIFVRNAVGLAGNLRYNSLKAIIEARPAMSTAPAGTARPWKTWQDVDSTQRRISIQEQGHPTCSKSSFNEALEVFAMANTVDPLQDYLQGLQWDGQARIRTLLSDHGGADPTAYTHEVTFRWFISAVARALRPGCKVDHVLILEGKQGGRKTTFARMLASDPAWFVENLPADLKASQEVIRGCWICEISELAVFTKREIGDLKAFISAQDDNYRTPYHTFPGQYPRRCVFIGTVNPSHEGYLRDSTGARRFWVVPVGTIDTDAIKPQVDQLWAEAVHYFKQGEDWYLRDQAIIGDAERMQETRFAFIDDPLYEWYEAYVERVPTFDYVDNGRRKPRDPAEWPLRDEPLKYFNTAHFLESIGRSEVDHKSLEITRKILKYKGWEKPKGAMLIEYDGERTRRRCWTLPAAVETPDTAAVPTGQGTPDTRIGPTHTPEKAVCSTVSQCTENGAVAEQDENTADDFND